MRSPPGRRRRPRSLGVGLDEHEQQAVQQPGRGVVQLPDGDGVDAAPTGDQPQLGEERPPGRDEHRDAGPERDPLPAPAAPEHRREVDGLGLGVVARGSGPVEVAHQRFGEPPARVAERVAICLGHDGPELGAVAMVSPYRRRYAAFRRSVESPTPPSAPMAPVRRVATRRSRARRSNRRCPPSVVNAGTRPSSAQRRSVSGSTPSRRLAWPSGSRSAGGRSGRDRASGTSPPCPGVIGPGRVVGNLGKPRSLHANVAGGV